MNLRENPREALTSAFMAVPCHPYKQKRGLSWPPAVAVQCSGSFQQHLYHILIAHKRPQPSLDAIPLNLLKEHCSWIWFTLAANCSLLPEIQILKGELSTTLSIPMNQFFSVIMGHDIYLQVAVPIFLPDVMQAKAVTTTLSLTGEEHGLELPGIAGRTFKCSNGPDVVCMPFVWHCGVTKQCLAFVWSHNEQTHMTVWVSPGRTQCLITCQKMPKSSFILNHWNWLWQQKVSIDWEFLPLWIESLGLFLLFPSRSLSLWAKHGSHSPSRSTGLDVLLQIWVQWNSTAPVRLGLFCCPLDMSCSSVSSFIAILCSGSKPSFMFQQKMFSKVISDLCLISSAMRLGFL